MFSRVKTGPSGSQWRSHHRGRWRFGSRGWGCFATALCHLGGWWSRTRSLLRGGRLGIWVRIGAWRGRRLVFRRSLRWWGRLRSSWGSHRIRSDERFLLVFLGKSQDQQTQAHFYTKLSHQAKALSKFSPLPTQNTRSQASSPQTNAQYSSTPMEVSSAYYD